MEGIYLDRGFHDRGAPRLVAADGSDVRVLLHLRSRMHRPVAVGRVLGPRLDSLEVYSWPRGILHAPASDGDAGGGKEQGLE